MSVAATGSSGVAIAALVLGIASVLSDGCGLCGVAVANLVGAGVYGEGVVVGRGVLTATAAEAAEEAGLGAGARGVVVLWAGAEALLLAVVTSQSDFD